MFGVMQSRGIAADLAAIRKRAGYGMREFAAAVGEPSSTYATYEQGRFKQPFIPMRKIRKWAPHLVGRGSPPVTIEEVMRLAGASPDYSDLRPKLPDRPQPGQFVDDPDELAWLRFWRSLEPDDRRAVLRLLGLQSQASASA